MHVLRVPSPHCPLPFRCRCLLLLSPGPMIVRPCLVLSYTRLVLGERSPLGRAAALLARCPPPTTSNLDLLCGADRHPSSPFALYLYLGPRLVNVVSLRKRPNSLYLQNKLSPYLDALQHLSPLPPVLCQLLPLRHLQLTQQRPRPSAAPWEKAGSSLGKRRAHRKKQLPADKME
jgi:hypothetical protein